MDGNYFFVVVEIIFLLVKQSDSVATSGTRGSRKRHRPEGDYAIEGENASESEASEFTDITHVSITPANKVCL